MMDWTEIEDMGIRVFFTFVMVLLMAFGALAFAAAYREYTHAYQPVPCVQGEAR